MKLFRPILATVALAAVSAQAQLYFINTGTPDNSGGNSVYYVNSSLGQFVAQQFTIDTPTDLRQMDVYLGNPGLLTVQVTSQIGAATTPADVLMSFSLGGPVDGPGWVGTGVGFSLDPGTYYMVFSATAPITLPSAPPVDVGPTFYSTPPGNTLNGAFPPGSTYGQLSPTSLVGIRMAAVPEPGETAAAMAVGLAGFALWRKCRRA